MGNIQASDPVPAAAPSPQGRCPQRLQAIGRRIRGRRRQLGISAMATAAAAGMSRVTLHRIETGAASVTLGALMNVLDALDLSFGQLEGAEDLGAQAAITTRAEAIELAAYPLLQQLAWHVQGTGTLSPAEAAGLYARQRRRLDQEELQPQERQLIALLTHAIPEPDVPA
ncbi:helix-turn-helix domain-containing protein [Cyanobium sp. Aljojuca 7D2]|uniref:helix-turn-helix domain-containing protein n=1 Tax=Cyanobium sp. Aljojuca 7D2 TaxID=2823698 RepID=UPI0020CD9ABC|nr:helix-turn-helix domain-containing protein [Cyanobium sp. Aljojuca 7D2]MCP9891890.1 helix-turn-helix domain-containing protein [Cyanobium sp. Aljojuca 7D2]